MSTETLPSINSQSTAPSKMDTANELIERQQAETLDAMQEQIDSTLSDTNDPGTGGSIFGDSIEDAVEQDAPSLRDIADQLSEQQNQQMLQEMNDRVQEQMKQSTLDAINDNSGSGNNDPLLQEQGSWLRR